MQSSRLTLRSNLGYNINNNNGQGGSSVYDQYTEYIEVQWQRRWLEPGQFTIYMPYNDTAFKYAVLATLENREETGIITKRNVETTPEGTFLTLSGYFAEGILRWGKRVRQLGGFNGSNYAVRLARFIAELLTSKHDGNRDWYQTHHDWGEPVDVLTEEGKIQPTGSSDVTYYPILMHTEIGPIRNSTLDFSSVTELDYDTKTKDACEWVYSTFPKNISLRTLMFTYADKTSRLTEPLMDDCLEIGYPVFGKGDLARIDLSTTPAFVAGFKFIQGTTRNNTIFSTANGNVSKISFCIDETNNRSNSRAHLDSDVGWWTNSYKADRGLMFLGDDGTYKYRGEVGWHNDTYVPGHISSGESGYTPYGSANKWGGKWYFGKMYPVTDVDANVTAEISTQNAKQIRSEMLSQAKLNLLNSYREESVEFEPIETSSCQYLTNYDLGDTVKIELITNNTCTARIVEIDEVHAKNHVEMKIRTDNPRVVRRK